MSDAATPCAGLRIGLKPKSLKLKVGGRLEYALGIANEGAAPRTLILFNDTEGTYRTRVRIEVAGRKPLFMGLVVPPQRTQGGHKITITVPPGKVHVSDGWLTLPKELKGKLTLVPIFGGTAAMACEVRGAPVSVSVD